MDVVIKLFLFRASEPLSSFFVASITGKTAIALIPDLSTSSISVSA